MIIKRTTKNNLFVEVDKEYGLKDKVRFTARVLAPTSEPNIRMNDTVIVERDYIQFIGEKTGFAPRHSWYACVRGEEIVPIGEFLYLKADKDKNNTFDVNGKTIYFPENFKQYQTEITTHDAIVAASPVDYIKPGDKVYAHHHLTHPSNERIIGGELYYQLQLNQIYCVVSDGIQCYNGWNLVEPTLAKNDSNLKLHKFDTDKSDRYAIVAHPDINATHLEKGQEIAFLPDMDYEIIVEGKKYFRIRTDCIVARCETK